MVELRKRPAPPPAPLPAKKKSTGKIRESKAVAPKEVNPPASNPAEDATGGLPKGAGGVSATAEINTAAEASVAAATAETNAVKPTVATTGAKSAAPTVGERIGLNGFGGEVETHDGLKVTLAKLVDESKAGVVLFTYPKASTPGCTTQACLFRDAYDPLTATGLSIYGLSTDLPKANLAFKSKQNLPYPLLCDPSATLIQAIGFKKAPKGTVRGVFVIDKNGQVLAAEPGGPAPTVEVVKKLVARMGDSSDASGMKKTEARAEDLGIGTEINKMAADVAAEVADSAQTLDKAS